MKSGWMLAARAVALLHLTLLVVLVFGGPITLWRSRFARVHAPSLVATGAVFLAGADCPLTNWEKSCLRRAGRTPYEGGFIEYYLVHPVTGGGVTPAVRATIVGAWVVPTGISWAILRRRAVRAR